MRVWKIWCFLLLVFVFFVLFEELDEVEVVIEGDVGVIVDVMNDMDVFIDDFFLKLGFIIKCGFFMVIVVGLLLLLLLL